MYREAAVPGRISLGGRVRTRMLAVATLALAPAILARDAPRPSPRPGPRGGAAAAALPSPVATREYRLDEPLPFEPAVRRGTLANGMTYYIRRNRRPERRVALRLGVNAGSVLEEEDPRG